MVLVVLCGRSAGTLGIDLALDDLLDARDRTGLQLETESQRLVGSHALPHAGFCHLRVASVAPLPEAHAVPGRDHSGPGQPGVQLSASEI